MICTGSYRLLCDKPQAAEGRDAMMTRAMKWTAAVLFAAALFMPRPAFGQAEVRNVPTPDLPEFYFDALCFSSEQSGVSRLDLYVEVPNEAIHFTKDGDVFKAGYDVTADFYDSSGTLISDKWWNQKIETKSYEQSVAPKSASLTTKSFLMPAGTYDLSVQIKDNETEKVSRLKRRIVVRDFFTPSFSLSDIMLVGKLDEEGGKKIVYPNVSGNVGDLSEGFFLFFEVYNRLGADSAMITAEIRNLRGDVVQQDSFEQVLGADKKSCFHKENTSKLLAGDYTIEMHALPQGKGDSAAYREVSASASRMFVIRWRGMPVSIVDLDKAIDEMQYVANKEQLDEMKKATGDKRKQMFEEFWKKRDPTPNTERNELMEEYYARVAYANKHFTHYIEGWKTDMGMVYIIFGPPSNVERHPFDIDSKPYEIWTYYEQNREFVFIDATGFGDYRLQTPIWDVYNTRPR